MFRRPENVLRSADEERLPGTSLHRDYSRPSAPGGDADRGCWRRGGSSAGCSAPGNSGGRRGSSKRRGSAERRGGRSLAISTAIHGSGTDTATIATEIRPLCQAPYARAARISAGTRNAIRVRYLRTRARCSSSYEGAALVINTG